MVIRAKKTTNKKPDRKKSDNEHRGNESYCQSFFQKLPGDGDIVSPTNVRDEKVCKLRGGHGEARRSEGGRHLHRPHQRVDVPLLR